VAALAHFPWGCWWTTPFARWQGALAHLHALRLAAHVAKDALARRGIDPARLDLGVLGTTVPQRGAFYGLPWVAGMLGAPQLAGPTIAQACATSARCVELAAAQVAAGRAQAALVITADRVSNGPLLVYPAPQAAGGAPETETWVLENFARDPWAGVAMVETAETVARRLGLTRAAQDELTLLRARAYWAARAAGFHARFMDLPFPVPDAALARTVAELDGDAGVQPVDEAKLRGLRPVLEGGTVTHGGQTHPADGSAGIVIASAARAAELARAPISARLLGVGQARVEAAHMPLAPVPAARAALAEAGLAIADIAIVTTHNPFAVNDLAFSAETGFPIERMNPHGCSLVWGHPQAPTGLRGLIELLEGLALRGGGRGLFTGCAAGDSAMALVVEVTDA
jgi:acetyl-CoA acetyltransferase family protein